MMTHKQRDFTPNAFILLSKDGDYAWRSIQHMRRHLRCLTRKFYRYNGYPPSDSRHNIIDVDRLVHWMHTGLF